MVNNTNLTPAAEPDTSPHPHGDFDDEQYFQVRTILDESKLKYLIDWEDDERTGARYDPTWEPKENVNEEAIADWEAQKAARKAGRSL